MGGERLISKLHSRIQNCCFRAGVCVLLRSNSAAAATRPSAPSYERHLCAGCGCPHLVCSSFRDLTAMSGCFVQGGYQPQL